MCRRCLRFVGELAFPSPDMTDEAPPELKVGIRLNSPLLSAKRILSSFTGLRLVLSLYPSIHTLKSLLTHQVMGHDQRIKQHL